MSRKKGAKNLNPVVFANVDMNMSMIAKELNITQRQAETALKSAIRKFRQHFKKQNIQKENYL